LPPRFLVVIAGSRRPAEIFLLPSLRARIPAREAIQGKTGAFVNKDKTFIKLITALFNSGLPRRLWNAASQ
jgi:hypothetical protein